MTVTTADQAPRRRGRPGYDLEAVLQVAVEVFNERGYDGASMEDLSKRLGIAKSGIYHHVSGKEELLRLALDRALDGLWEAAQRAQALDAPAIVRLETLVRDAIAVLAAQLPYVTLLLRVRGNTDVERAALARRRAFDALVASLVEEAERDGDIRADIDPKLTARLLFGTVNSIVEWYRPAAGALAVSAASAVSAAALADAVCAIAFDGLRVRPVTEAPLRKPGYGIRRAQPGSWSAVARARTVAGYAIPGIVVFFFWLVVVILAIILLAFIVHWAGGAALDLRLGHFNMNVGFT